jgi:SAM-dependent methyltransferase
MIYVDGGEKLRSLTMAGARLLDIGCGTGVTVSSYRVGMQNVEIYGIDAYHEPDEVQSSIKYTKQDIDGAVLPYEDGFFDVVVLCHILEHVRSPITLIREAFRVLRPGGVIYVETPSVRSMRVPDLRFLREQYAAANYYDDFTHIGRPQTGHSLFHLLNRNGFDVLEVEFARPRHWILKGIRHVVSGTLHKNRVTLCTGIWYLVGWAIYGVGRKNEDKKVPSHV